MRVGGATSQLGLPSLTPLSVAGCGRLQLEVSHLGYFRRLLNVVDNLRPTFCGSRFSTGLLLSIEDELCLYLLLDAAPLIPPAAHLAWIPDATDGSLRGIVYRLVR